MAAKGWVRPASFVPLTLSGWAEVLPDSHVGTRDGIRAISPGPEALC